MYIYKMKFEILLFLRYLGKFYLFLEFVILIYFNFDD